MTKEGAPAAPGTSVTIYRLLDGADLGASGEFLSRRAVFLRHLVFTRLREQLQLRHQIRPVVRLCRKLSDFPRIQGRGRNNPSC